jgi:myo-inositol-1(or 4)-monophosphatase
MIDLDAVVAVAREAAHEAAAIVLRGYRKHPTASHKGPIDLVTSYDRESEVAIRERLGRAFPWPVVGEEGTAKTAATDGAVFYVDPLDGTTNFVHGHPFWCVSIGLVIDGAPAAGVVVAPVLGVEWTGYAYGGKRAAARRSSTGAWTGAATELLEPCQPSATTVLAESLLATGFPYDRRTSADDNLDAFVHLKKIARGIRRCGSAAMDLCLVADGTYDGYWERKLSPWDVAAGIAIVHGAGGRTTAPDGRGDALQSGHIVATNGLIHAELVAELACLKERET